MEDQKLIKVRKRILAMVDGKCPYCEGTIVVEIEADGPSSKWTKYRCRNCNKTIDEHLRKASPK